MTDDITRGLSLLADEVAPAPVDGVAETARARTRNRRAGAATALAVVVAGTLAVSLGRDEGVRVSDPPTERAARLTAELAEIEGEIALPGWERLPAGTPGPLDVSLAGGKPFSFACRDAEEGDEPLPIVAVCQAVAQYERGDDRLSVAVQVFTADGLAVKAAPGEVVALAGGGKAVVRPTGHMLTVGHRDVLRRNEEAYPAAGTQLMTAWRPRHTGIIVNVAYTGTEPPFTDEQLLAFATAFTW
ncbi:hypothetical protein [Actinophytocola sp. KF-1]